MNIKDVTLDEAYQALRAVDYISEFTRRKNGPVSEWNFVVKRDSTTLSNTCKLIVIVPAGTYTLVREEASRNWVTLITPEGNA